MLPVGGVMAEIYVEGSDLKANENEEEDEEEDMDFNPFLKGTPSPEASSSLSSEVEGLEEGVKEVRSGEVRNYDVGNWVLGRMWKMGMRGRRRAG